MIRFIYLIIPLAIACGNSQDASQTNKKTDPRTMDLHGRVVSVKEMSYTTMHPNMEGAVPTFTKTIFFNESGFITSVEDNGETINYLYKDSTLLEAQVFSNQHILIQRHTFVNNMPDSSIQYWDGKMIGLSVNRYEKNGNLYEGISFNRNGKVYQKFRHTYDSKNREIKLQIFDSANRLTLLNTFEYDNNGNKAALIIYNVSTRLITAKETYRYDKENNLVQTTAHSPDNRPVYTTTYRTERQYDSHKNWTQEIRYVNGLKNSMKERVIVYRQ